MRKKHIMVTQADIDNGVRKSFAECPVNFAVRRAWRTVRPVFVRHEGVFVGTLDDEPLWIAPLPPMADRFVTNFDKGLNVTPLEFDLVFR